jgi:hypothetical protein
VVVVAEISFAYSGILTALDLASSRLGVGVRWVRPDFTSISGFAKFSSRLGLGID